MALPRHTSDTALPAWLAPRLLPRGPAGVPVGATVPKGFAAYARVLHPLQDGRRWREITASNGGVLHPLAQWSHYFGTLNHLNLWPPDGHLPRPDHDALLTHLPMCVSPACHQPKTSECRSSPARETVTAARQPTPLPATVGIVKRRILSRCGSSAPVLLGRQMWTLQCSSVSWE